MSTVSALLLLVAVVSTSHGQGPPTPDKKPDGPDRPAPPGAQSVPMPTPTMREATRRPLTTGKPTTVPAITATGKSKGNTTMRSGKAGENDQDHDDGNDQDDDTDEDDQGDAKLGTVEAEKTHTKFLPHNALETTTIRKIASKVSKAASLPTNAGRAVATGVVRDAAGTPIGVVFDDGSFSAVLSGDAERGFLLANGDVLSDADADELPSVSRPLPPWVVGVAVASALAGAALVVLCVLCMLRIKAGYFAGDSPLGGEFSHSSDGGDQSSAADETTIKQFLQSPPLSPMERDVDDSFAGTATISSFADMTAFDDGAGDSVFFAAVNTPLSPFDTPPSAMMSDASFANGSSSSASPNPSEEFDTRAMLKGSKRSAPDSPPPSLSSSSSAAPKPAVATKMPSSSAPSETNKRRRKASSSSSSKHTRKHPPTKPNASLAELGFGNVALSHALHESHALQAYSNSQRSPLGL
jgi:hypothetical protein